MVWMLVMCSFICLKDTLNTWGIPLKVHDQSKWKNFVLWKKAYSFFIQWRLQKETILKIVNVLLKKKTQSSSFRFAKMYCKSFCRTTPLNWNGKLFVIFFYRHGPRFIELAMRQAGLLTTDLSAVPPLPLTQQSSSERDLTLSFVSEVL